MSSSDFPVLACAVSNKGNDWYASVGARPGRAVVKQFTLSEKPSKEEIDNAVLNITKTMSFGTNMRGNMKYRRLLADVLIKRNIEEIIGGSHAN
jgi:CO/xanthine dehydrogenase FAD-binding subunit